MVTYYHGTSQKNLRSILTHGLCPPRTCPVFSPQNWPGCDRNSVFVTEDVKTAIDFAADRKGVIFRVQESNIPKRAVILPDPAFLVPKAWRIRRAGGCIKPEAYCKFHAKTSHPSLINSLFFDPEDCKWVKV